MDERERAELQRGLTELADGNRDAFRGVFLRLWPVLRAFAARHLVPEDAEDAAQYALLKLFEHASEFDPKRDALAWALGVTAWEIRTSWRRRWRRREVPDDPEVAYGRADGSPGPEKVVIARDLAASLGRALEDLSSPDVEALLDFAHEERPAGATFRKRLERARARLRAAWRQRHG